MRGVGKSYILPKWIFTALEKGFRPCKIGKSENDEICKTIHKMFGKEVIYSKVNGEKDLFEFKYKTVTSKGFEPIPQDPES